MKRANPAQFIFIFKSLSAVAVATLLMALATSQAQADVQVEYKISKLQGLVDFALALSGEPHQSPGLVETFQRSRFNTPETKKWLEGFTVIHSSLMNGYQFSGTPVTRRDGAQTLKLIQTQSLFSSSLQDLSTRSLGLLPLALHRDYFALLEKLEPIYNDLIWKSSEKPLRAHQEELTRFAKKADLNRMFTATEKFYHGSWPKGVPFSIGLYPVPYIKGFKNYTISQSIGSIEEHGVLIGAKDLDTSESFGVIFHELCHSLYNTQSPEFMKQLDRWFASSPSALRVPAQNWFNEAMATAIGNGWANARIHGGKLSQQSWYSNTVIDTYAKAIYPIVNQTLSRGGALDEPMVHKIIDAFAQSFPNGLTTFDIWMNNVVFLHNGNMLNESDYFSAFNRSFQLSSLSSENSLTSHQATETASNPLATLVIQLSSDDLAHLNDFSDGIPLLKLKEEFLKRMPKRSVAVLSEKTARPVIVIIADSAQDFSDALASMAKAKSFDPATPAHSY